MFSLRKTGTSFPFLVLHPKGLDQEVHAALDARGIWKLEIDPLPCKTPTNHIDTRFNHTWSKLRVFSLTEFERIVLLDCDMIVLQNIDELMDLAIDSTSMNGKGDEVFAACHVCACNPMRRGHYPPEWYVSSAAFSIFLTYIETGLQAIARILANTRILAAPKNADLVLLMVSACSMVAY